MSLRLLEILVWVTKVMGLLPISISYHPIYARASRRAAVQSIIHCSILIPLIVATTCLFLWSISERLQKQTTLLLTTALAWVLAILCTCSMYIIQFRRRDELVRLFNDALRVRVMFMISYGTMYSDAPFLDAKCRRLVLWKLGSLLVQMGFLLMAFFNYELGSLGVLGVRLTAWVVLLIGTDLVMIVYTTLHFAVVLVALQMFRDCNARLTDSVNVVRELLLCRRQSKLENATAMVRLHSNITVDIDRIALLYEKVTEFAQRVNGVFEVPQVLALMHSFLFILVTLYSLVHDISKLVDFEQDSQPPQIVFNSLGLLYFCVRVYFFVWISDAMIEEANKTGRILCRTASFQIDKVTKECIEMFSISILQGDKLMVACGMFSVDKTLIYGMVGAITSYLTILIQFDLAGNSANKGSFNATL